MGRRNKAGAVLDEKRVAGRDLDSRDTARTDAARSPASNLAASLHRYCRRLATYRNFVMIIPHAHRSIAISFVIVARDTDAINARH